MTAAEAVAAVVPRCEAPPLADALSAMLPSSGMTLFLRACLQRGDALRDAWAEWSRRVDPLAFVRDSERGAARHLALLYANLRENDVSIDAAFEPYLRTALVHERLRGERLDRGAREVVRLLREAGIDFTLLKGLALARTSYPATRLRHCHDVDLLVDRCAQEAVEQALGGAYRVVARGGGTVRLAHESGLAVAVHTTLLSHPVYRMPTREILERRASIEYGDGPVSVLSPADLLLHVCAHASTASRRPSASWVADAHALLAAHPSLNWERLLRTTEASGLALPLHVLLEYLALAIGAPIPVFVRDRLREVAWWSDGRLRAAAIDGAWRGRPGGLGAMLVRSGWRSRLEILGRTPLVLEGAFFRRFGGATRPGSEGGGRVGSEARAPGPRD